MNVRLLIRLVILLQGALLCSAYSGKYVNTRCEVNSDCGLDNHLQCINNLCSCDSRTQIFNQGTQKCHLFIGQKCQLPKYAKDQYRPDLTPTPVKCIPDADCIKSVCHCKSGLRQTQDFLCEPGFGSSCTVNNHCNWDLGLVCAQGNCQCFNSTWSYKDPFGCVHPDDIDLLNEAETLLRENNVDIREAINELANDNFDDNVVAQRRQDTYNTNDLIFAAQNDNAQSTGASAFNLRNFFMRLRARYMGFVKNVRSFFRGSPGGYPEASTTTTAAPEPAYGPPKYGPPATGYGAPGQPEGGPLAGGALSRFVGNLRMRYRNSVMRFRKYFQNLRSRWFGPPAGGSTPAPAADPPPPAPAIQNPAPTVIPTGLNAPPPANNPAPENPAPDVIQSNGNFQNNPIFDNNSPNSSGQSNQGQGTVQFLRTTRERFRNLLRGNQVTGGYASGPAPAGADSPPPPAEGGGAEPAGSSNFFTNNPSPNRPSSFRVQQQQHFSAVISQSNGRQASAGGTSQLTQYNSQQRHERQPSFEPTRPSSSVQNPRQNLNHQSFFSNSQQSLSSSSNNQFQRGNSNSFNAQASSLHPAAILPRPQTLNHQPTEFERPPPSRDQRPPSFDQPASVYSSLRNKNAFPEQNLNSYSSIESETSPIQRFQLPPSEREPPSQNYILEEDSDLDQRFRSESHSTVPTPTEPSQYDYVVNPNLKSYRDTPRFERIGEDDEEYQERDTRSNAQSWRETF